MRRIHPLLLLSLITISYLSIQQTCAAKPTKKASSGGIAVMGLDLGSEFYKVAIVKPGVPMDIALNGDSKRKSPTIVTIKGDDTMAGSNAAQTTGIKFPGHSFKYFMGLIGHDFDSPVVKNFQSYFPEVKLVKNMEGTVAFEHPDFPDMPVAIEQIVALVLKSASETAATAAETDRVRDCVITVPVFMSQTERKRLIYIAENLANLKVLQLINDNAAITLNYGMFRRKEFADAPKTMVLLDMGATRTSASVVKIEIDEKSKDPTATILGVSWNRELGGVKFDLRIRDVLKKKFEEKNPKLAPVTKPRAMAKLLKEAQRVRQVLSANANTQARIENLTGDDVDLKELITREEFEELCKDLLEQTMEPIDKAIEMSGLDKATGASEVLLFGGLTRTPWIKSKLEENGFTILANINTDEAAAIGASYRAADLSSAFRVKPFAVKNASPVQIQVEFDREIVDEDTGETKIKHSKRVLFAPGNSFPQKKVLTFNRYTDDFSFQVKYGNPEDYKHLTTDHDLYSSSQLMEVKVSGVASALEKHATATPKGIKVHFNLDDSGLFIQEKIEQTFEEEQLIEEKKPEKKSADGDAEDKEGEKGSDKKGTDKEADNIFKTLDMNDFKDIDWNDPASTAKLNAKFKDMKFDLPKKEKNEKKPDSAESEETETDIPAEDSDETKPEEPKSDEKPAEETTAEGDEKPAAEGEEEPPKPKYRKVKRSLALEASPSHVGLADPVEDKTKIMSVWLEQLDAKQQEKREREAALNDIETFIYDKNDKLYQEEGYSETATQEEKDKIQATLSAASDWLWEVEDPTADIYRKKLKELEEACKGWLYRANQLLERPKILQSFEDQFNNTKHLIAAIEKNQAAQPEDDKTFTEKEVETLKKKFEDAVNWKNETVKKQKELKDTDEPVLTLDASIKESEKLRREVDFMIKKAKTWRPKKKEEPKKDETAKDAKEEKTTSDGSADEKKADGDEQPKTEEETTRKDDSEEEEKKKHSEL